MQMQMPMPVPQTQILYPPQQHIPTSTPVPNFSNVVINQPHPQALQPSAPVIIQQTVSGPPKVPVGHKLWATTLCDCFQDIPSCCLGWCFPCCLGCWIASRYNESCCVGCCGVSTLAALRTKIRVDHQIQGSICEDYICMTILQPLILCQMHRELNHKGYV